MNFAFAGVLALTAFLLLLGGCVTGAHQPETSRVSESHPSSPADKDQIAHQSLEAIQSSNSLSPHQKSQLIELHTRIAVDTRKIQGEIIQLKAELFEIITNSPYRPRKADGLKKKLVQLNDQKMKNMINALNEVEKIVGYSDTLNLRQLYKGILFEGHQGPHNL